jgi:hypothetical protein
MCVEMRFIAKLGSLCQIKKSGNISVVHVLERALKPIDPFVSIPLVEGQDEKTLNGYES